MSYILKKILNEKFKEIYNNVSVKPNYLGNVFDECSKEYADYQNKALAFIEAEDVSKDAFKHIALMSYEKDYPDIVFTDDEKLILKPIIDLYGESGNTKYLETIKDLVLNIVKRHGYSHLKDFDITRSIEESLDDVTLN